MKELFEAWNQHLLDEAKEDVLRKKYEKKLGYNIISGLNRWANEIDNGTSMRTSRIKYLQWMYKQAAGNPNFQHNPEAYQQWIQMMKDHDYNDEQIADPEGHDLGGVTDWDDSVEPETISRDFQTLSDNIDSFIKFNKTLPKDKRDINRIKDVDELKDIIWDSVHQKRIEKSLAGWKSIDDSDTLLGDVYDGRFTIIRPLTREAAQRFGCTAEWCIGQGGSMFDEYTKNGKVFYYVQDHARKNTGDPYQQITIEYEYPYGRDGEVIINQVWDRYNNDHDSDWLGPGGLWWEAMVELDSDIDTLNQILGAAEESAEHNPPESQELMKYEDDELLNEEFGVDEDGLKVEWNASYDDGYLFIGGRARWRIPIKTSFEINPQPEDEQYPLGLTHPKIVEDQETRMMIIDLDDELVDFVQEEAYFYADGHGDTDGFLSQDENDPGHLFFSYNIYLDETAFDHEERLRDEIGHMAYLLADHKEEYLDKLTNFCISKFPQLFDIKTLQIIVDLAENELLGLDNFQVMSWDPERPLDGFVVTQTGELQMPLNWSAGDIRFRDKATAKPMAFPLPVFRHASDAYNRMNSQVVDIANKHNLHHKGATEQLYKIIGSLHDKALAFSQNQLKLNFGPDFKLQPDVVNKLEKSLHFKVNWHNPSIRNTDRVSTSSMGMTYQFNPDKVEDFAAAVAYIKYIDENYEYIIKEMMGWSLEAQIDVNKILGGTAEAFKQEADNIFKKQGYPAELQESKKHKKFRFKVKRKF